jgi:hypothetical protein
MAYTIKVLPKDSNFTDRKRVLINKETKEVSPRVFSVKRHAVEAAGELNSGGKKTKYNWIK